MITTLGSGTTQDGHRSRSFARVSVPPVHTTHSNMSSNARYLILHAIAIEHPPSPTLIGSSRRASLASCSAPAQNRLSRAICRIYRVQCISPVQLACQRLLDAFAIAEFTLQPVVVWYNSAYLYLIRTPRTTTPLGASRRGLFFCTFAKC
jgi:hypothetical protein